MKKLISCAYHEDSQTVGLRYTGRTPSDNDCMAVEDEAVWNMYERSDLIMLYNVDSLILLRYCFLHITIFPQTRNRGDCFQPSQSLVFSGCLAAALFYWKRDCALIEKPPRGVTSLFFGDSNALRDQ